MPDLVEEYTNDRLVPFKPNYQTDAMPFHPAGAGQTYTIMKGDPIAVNAGSKRAQKWVEGAPGVAGKCLGVSEHTITVDDKGKCWLGESAAIDAHRGSNITSPVFIAGTISPEDAAGLTAAAIASWGAELRQDGSVHKPF